MSQWIHWETSISCALTPCGTEKSWQTAVSSIHHDQWMRQWCHNDFPVPKGNTSQQREYFGIGGGYTATVVYVKNYLSYNSFTKSLSPISMLQKECTNSRIKWSIFNLCILSWALWREEFISWHQVLHFPNFVISTY